MKIFVINLPEDKERLIHMKNMWPEFEVVEGIRHPVPYSGCNLAHINAVKKGFENDDYCLVLEDDASYNNIPHLLEVIDDIVKVDGWDCIVFGYEKSEIDYSIPGYNRVHKYCIQIDPTMDLIQTQTVLYHKSILSKINEFEKVIKENMLPIDRLLFNDNWTEKEWSKLWIHRGSPIKDISWNPLRVWCCDDEDIVMNLKQSEKFISNNDGRISYGNTRKQQTLDFLRKLPLSNKIRENLPCNFQIKDFQLVLKI